MSQYQIPETPLTPEEAKQALLRTMELNQEKIRLMNELSDSLKEQRMALHERSVALDNYRVALDKYNAALDTRSTCIIG